MRPKGSDKTPGSGIKKGQTHAESKKRTVREIVEQCLGKTIPERLLEIAKENPLKEAEILDGLMPYTYPKLQAVEMKATVDHTETTEAIQELADQLRQMKLDSI